MNAVLPTGATWSELVSVALVGTERKPPPPAVADVAALVGADLDGRDSEVKLLTAVGVVAALRRAGLAVVHRNEDASDPAPPDHRPEAPSAAVQVLELVLGEHVTVVGGPVPLVAFWLDRCAASGRKVPARLVPTLLDLATRERPVREPLVAAGGPLVAWLAARNPRWAWAAEAGGAGEHGDVRSTWHTGDHVTRLALLRRLRATQPALSRALVGETWSGEKAEDRARILDAFAIGLADEDEPFLEAALDDRAKSVRITAARLLAGLPSSRLAARMSGRLRPLVSRTGPVPKKLEVALPDEPDQAARRDGVTDDGAPPRTGPRSWWLIQLIAATPLSFWWDELGLRPAELVELASQPELEHGWATAAIRQRDREWIETLLRRGSDLYAPALLAALPPHEARAKLEPVLRTCADAAVPRVLAAAPGPWSLPVTRSVLARVRAAKAKTVLPLSLPVVAAAADPAIGPDLEQWLADLAGNDPFRRQVRQVAHTLSIRQTIAEAFSSP